MTVDYKALIREARANWMTISTMAERYAIPHTRIRAYIATGKVEAFWIDGQYRVSPTSLEAHLATMHRRVAIE